MSAAAVCLTATGCGTHTTMGVDGLVRAPKDAGGKCDSTQFKVGEDVVLRGADESIMAIDRLGAAKDTAPDGSCDFPFHFDKVKPDEAAYQLTVGSSRRVVVTEDQLRVKDFVVVQRGTTRSGDPVLKVIDQPSPSPEPTH